MITEKHNGTGHYCGECMHLDKNCDGCNPTFEAGEGSDGEWMITATGSSACPRFIPSLAAQRLEQLRIGNELRALRAEMYADVNDWVPWKARLNSIRDKIRGPE